MEYLSTGLLKLILKAFCIGLALDFANGVVLKGYDTYGDIACKLYDKSTPVCVTYYQNLAQYQNQGPTCNLTNCTNLTPGAPLSQCQCILQIPPQCYLIDGVPSEEIIDSAHPLFRSNKIPYCLMAGYKTSSMADSVYCSLTAESLGNSYVSSSLVVQDATFGCQLAIKQGSYSNTLNDTASFTITAQLTISCPSCPAINSTPDALITTAFQNVYGVAPKDCSSYFIFEVSNVTTLTCSVTSGYPVSKVDNPAGVMKLIQDFANNLNSLFSQQKTFNLVSSTYTFNVGMEWNRTTQYTDLDSVQVSLPSIVVASYNAKY